jgi:hypothetical protein
VAAEEYYMTKPILNVDFNEMLNTDLVLVSQGDVKFDVTGNPIHLRVGMLVSLYSEDFDAEGKPDHLIAEGTIERNNTEGWAAHVRWCCRIDGNGIRNQSQQ